MKYLGSSFSVNMGENNEFRENYDRVFAKDRPHLTDTRLEYAERYGRMRIHCRTCDVYSATLVEDEFTHDTDCSPEPTK